MGTQEDALQPNMSVGDSLHGPIFCEPFGLKVVSSGYFTGEDPAQFTLSILMLQIGSISFISAFLHFLLRPLGQPKYISDLLGGILLGPSLWGHDSAFYKLMFSDKALMVLDVFEQVGIAVFCFLIGLRTDVGVIKRSGGLALSIGIVSFLLSFIFDLAASIYLRAMSTAVKDKDVLKSLTTVVFLESMINYHVIYTILSGVKLVNSELGRLALTSSMISTFLTWVLLLVARAMTDARRGMGLMLAEPLCRLLAILVIINVLRPIMFWMIRNTPEGKNVKESYICALTLMIFGLSLYSEITGAYHAYTLLILGMAVPKGPPLASGLEDKLELFVSAVLMPSFMLNLGRKVDIHLITANTFKVIELLIAVAFFGKMAGCMLPSILWDMPVKDAFFLGLLMSSQGILDIQFFNRGRNAELITAEILTIMVIMAIIHAIIFNPLIKYIYVPKVRHLGYKRRTIQESLYDVEFRILACVHQEENIPTLISILEASNPTRDCPIAVYVLDLVELVGRAMPLFITHQLSRNPSSKSTRTNRIINAFNQYETRNQGTVTVQCFTSISPYASIHEDICILALEKRTSLAIISYNKSDPYSIRAMNRSVLETAPCSVGILVHKGMLSDTHSAAVQSWFSFMVCVIFIGGPDDREAVAYASRMVKHPSITLTIIRIIAANYSQPDLIETKLDLITINHLKADVTATSKLVYREEIVTEGYETTLALRSLEKTGCDLVLVGRRHASESPVMSGLSEWSEIQELGIIGDFLTSADFKCKASVMVMQQHGSHLDNMQQESLGMPAEVSLNNPYAAGTSVRGSETSRHSQSRTQQPIFHQAM